MMKKDAKSLILILRRLKVFVLNRHLRHHYVQKLLVYDRFATRRLLVPFCVFLLNILGKTSLYYLPSNKIPILGASSRNTT
jgi:hypothetical protein